MSKIPNNSGFDDPDDYLKEYIPEFTKNEKKELPELIAKIRKRNILRRILTYVLCGVVGITALLYIALSNGSTRGAGDIQNPGGSATPIAHVNAVPPKRDIPFIDTIIISDDDNIRIRFKEPGVGRISCSLRYPANRTGAVIRNWNDMQITDTDTTIFLSIPFQLDTGDYVFSLGAGSSKMDTIIRKNTGPLFRVSDQIYPWLDNHEENIRMESKLFHVPDEYRVADWAKDIKPRFKTPVSIDSFLRSITVNTNGLIDNWYNRTDSGWREKADNNTLFVNSNGSKVFKGKGKFAGRAFVITRWEHKPEGYDVLDSLKSGPERYVALGCWSDPHMRAYHILAIRKTPQTPNR
jgi:hypothetical protein